MYSKIVRILDCFVFDSVVSEKKFFQLKKLKPFLMTALNVLLKFAAVNAYHVLFSLTILFLSFSWIKVYGEKNHRAEQMVLNAFDVICTRKESNNRLLYIFSFGASISGCCKTSHHIKIRESKILIYTTFALLDSLWMCVVAHVGSC